jgi:hypothetical protein
LDTSGWNEAVIARANELRADLGYFVDGVMNERNIVADEYPCIGQ